MNSGQSKEWRRSTTGVETNIGVAGVKITLAHTNTANDLNIDL